MRKLIDGEKVNRITKTSDGYLISLDKPPSTLKETLPKVVGLDNRLQYIIGKGAKVTPEQIHQIAKNIGDAVLLFLCNRDLSLNGFMQYLAPYEDNGDIDQKMAEQIREYYHKMLWHTVMGAIGVPGHKRSSKERKAAIKRLQREMRKIEGMVSVTNENGRLLVKRGPMKKIYEGEDGVKVIPMKEIHDLKEVDMKRAVPITCVKLVNTKRAKK